MNPNGKLINWRAIILILAVIIGYYAFRTFVKKSPNMNEISTDSLVFKRGCYNNETGPCLVIDLAFPKINEGMSKRFCNNVLGDYLKQIDISSKCNTIDDFKTALLNYAYGVDSSYVKYIEEFKNDKINAWSQKITMSIINSSDKINVIKYSYVDYMGGAHGMYNTHYQNISSKKSEILTLNDVVTDTLKLSEIAENYFIKKVEANSMKYPDDFWFEDNKFSLPKEFALAPDFLILHYNVYEVASYAQGDIEVHIPYSVIRRLLKE